MADKGQHHDPAIADHVNDQREKNDADRKREQARPLNGAFLGFREVHQAAQIVEEQGSHDESKGCGKHRGKAAIEQPLRV